MNSGTSLENIFNTKPDGVSSVGRPKLRCEDGVNEDVKILTDKNWKNDALDRDEWTQLL
jgi:hypothetical protein